MDDILVFPLQKKNGICISFFFVSIFLCMFMFPMPSMFLYYKFFSSAKKLAKENFRSVEKSSFPNLITIFFEK